MTKKIKTIAISLSAALTLCSAIFLAHSAQAARRNLPAIFLLLLASDTHGSFASNWPVSIPYITGRTFDQTEPLSTPIGIGTTYYVNGSVVSSGNGLTLGTAKKTITEGVALLLAPGDRLLIKGGIYRENVVCNATGSTQANPFIIGPYNGEEVIIDPSVKVTGWSISDAENNIYVADTSGCAFPSGYFPELVVVNWYLYYPEDSLAHLQRDATDPVNPTDYTVRNKANNKRFWYDKDNQNLYIRSDLGNPDNCDLGVIWTATKGDSTNAIVAFQVRQPYYRIYGLTVRFAPYKGFYVGGVGYNPNYISLEWCRALYNGWAGINAGNGDHVTFYKCFAYHNSIANWPPPRFNATGGWDAGTGMGACTHGTIDGCVMMYGSGEGINCNGYLGNAYNTVKNCISAYNWGTNLYFDSEGYDTADGNLLLGKMADTSECYNLEYMYNLKTYEGKQPYSRYAYTRGVRATRPIGLETADEHDGAYCQHITLKNNIVLNCQVGWTHYALGTDSSMKYFSFYNNIIIMPKDLNPNSDYDPPDQIFAMLFSKHTGQSNVDSYFTNNIFVHNDNLMSWLFVYNVAPDIDNLFQGLYIDNNLYYVNPSYLAFYWCWDGESTKTYTYADWLNRPDAGGSHGHNDQVGDPLFPDITGARIIAGGNLLTKINDVAPGVGSPAINTGATLGSVTTDFWGVSRPQGAAYDIGAFEYVSGK